LDDFLFRGSLADFDPDVAELINLEAERQIRRLIMIPSESTIPWAVREALTSQFHNIYAEGYPPEETRTMSEADIMDVDMRLAEFRRYSDPRYYKGTEFANLLEALARRRTAELFAASSNGRVTADKLFVNVQPLSGAPANSAVYTALITPGDTIMGMNLLHGGHLSHGSPVARSGKQYNAVFYGVDPETELIDYDQAMQVALEKKPKIVIGGYSSYPYAPDWAKLRQIADAVGALLLADVAHVAGLVISGDFPSPVGIADIVTFTTHKTLGGPRGAVMITHRADLAKKLDRGVFPGEQGGPHMNTVAALAVALKLATTEQFMQLQHQTVKNAIHLAESLTRCGLRIVHGGTDTHLLTVDLKPLVGADGTHLSGDMAARLLDLVGITCNRNTLPSDDSAARPSGIRLGTPWITQRGFREAEIEELASVIASVLRAAKPFSYDGKGGKADARAKIDFATFREAQQRVADLCNRAGIDYTVPVVGSAPKTGRVHLGLERTDGVIEVRGSESGRFLRYALTSPVHTLSVGEHEVTAILDPEGGKIAEGVVRRTGADAYQLHVSNAEHVVAWLQALSDGFVIYDPNDMYGKIPGPVAIRVLDESPITVTDSAEINAAKDYFVGASAFEHKHDLPRFEWNESEPHELKVTPIHGLHKNLKAKLAPFAGYEMPLWYKGVSQEHAAVRTAAGIFDVTHMGVWDVRGAGAEHFLNGLTTNDVTTLKPGDAHYSYLLDVDGTPLDDIYVYRLKLDHFMIVVNASNNDKDMAWARAVREGSVQIDPIHTGIRLLDDPSHVEIRDLRDPASGADRRVDVALQGPKSTEILLSLSGSDADKKKVKSLAWSTITRVELGGFDLIVSRTGYTGERVAYELFVHPDQAAALFEALIGAGATPCGLAARDSLRTEAGLPLYGHELGGANELTPGDAGFASYVKMWKPFFVGKSATIEREMNREAEIARFRMDAKGVRPPQPGAPVMDRRGRVVGMVTSCSIDSEGYQCGQAYLKIDQAAEGTPLLIYGGSLDDLGKNGPQTIPSAGLNIGHKVLVPDTATVVSRFMKKK
jgi:glycine hydroxymethyltransferase